MFVDVFVDPNPNCPEGCVKRWKAESAPRPVARVRYFGDADEPIECAVEGWSSAGGGSPCGAHAVEVEDSGAGTAILVYGGDWGLRLTPLASAAPAPFGAAYLLVSAEDILG